MMEVVVEEEERMVLEEVREKKLVRSSKETIDTPLVVSVEKNIDVNNIYFSVHANIFSDNQSK